MGDTEKPTLQETPDDGESDIPKARRDQQAFCSLTNQITGQPIAQRPFLTEEI